MIELLKLAMNLAATHMPVLITARRHGQGIFAPLIHDNRKVNPNVHAVQRLPMSRN